MKEEEILGILPLHIRTIIKQADINWDELQEIRLRIQKPVILKYNAKTCYLSEQGKITTRKEQLHIVTSQEISVGMSFPILVQREYKMSAHPFTSCATRIFNPEICRIVLTLS